MRALPTDLPGVLIVEPDVHRDERGFFFESWHADKYARLGIETSFVQDNHSRSSGPVLRGLHAQLERPQAKLVRVSLGRIFDVAVDIRVGSPTFARWVGVELSADDARQLYLPEGYAHGFCSLSPVAEVQYKCSAFYDPEDELTVAWNDPEIAVDWPVTQPLLSDKDRGAERLKALRGRLPRWEAGP